MFKYFNLTNISIILIIFACQYTSGVQIKYIQVPSSVRNNTGKPIIMDCNYSVRSDDTNLVVKWFLNEIPVYQWIPPKRPQSLGVLRDRIDTSYTVSNDDKMAYRAIKILNPTTDIAGTYKCGVSTFADEDFREGHMVVFEPERDIKMMETLPKNGKVNFTCMVSETYPKPRITLFRNCKNDVINKNPLEPIEWDTIKHEDGRFTSYTIATANAIDLFEGDLINCEVRIPATGYVKLKSLVYFPLIPRKANNAQRKQLTLNLLNYAVILLLYNHII